MVPSLLERHELMRNMLRYVGHELTQSFCKRMHLSGRPKEVTEQMYFCAILSRSSDCEVLMLGLRVGEDEGGVVGESSFVSILECHLICKMVMEWQGL